MQAKEHWEKVYGGKAPEEVSWFQEHDWSSLRFIEESGVPAKGAFIDVGGGASTLVDDLLSKGWKDLTVLDLSAKALQAAQARLGTRAAKVTWLAGDITKIQLEAQRYDLWHDRAVFHFLVTPEERAAYKKALRHALKDDGQLVLATFAEDGPERCSGLPVKRYSSRELEKELGKGFALVGSARETHVTPAGARQNYVYCRFHKLCERESRMATPELALFISEILSKAAPAQECTAADIRAVLTGDSLFMSAEGELLFPLDRTSLVNELDELIERLGPDVAARDLLPGREKSS